MNDLQHSNYMLIYNALLKELRTLKSITTITKTYQYVNYGKLYRYKEV